MAILKDDDRKHVWAEFMRELSNNRESIDLSKQELYDVFAIVDDNTDAFIEQLRSQITSKAQAAMPERVWLQAIAAIVTARQKVEAKENPPPKQSAAAASVEAVK